MFFLCVWPPFALLTTKYFCLEDKWSKQGALIRREQNEKFKGYKCVQKELLASVKEAFSRFEVTLMLCHIYLRSLNLDLRIMLHPKTTFQLRGGSASGFF
ncbi:hypothetical protein GOODEAATRI_027498 [Goodea atripinnis]|uniref:Secreted protein n=1 Tax=Goodea atripinnis TaxID=208336 RepID=A0ABV0MLM8_9TELE